MITPRTTRLVRVADLHAFRQAVAALACDGPPLEARDRLIVVPTRSAAAHLVRSIEDYRLGPGGAVVLPDIITPGELIDRFAGRLDLARRRLTDAEREVLLGVACRVASEGGAEPPFHLRPGLIAEILKFYDSLRRRQNDIDAFERRTLERLEPGASYDRGAERLVRQTRFLVAAFRDFEKQCLEVGADEHEHRAQIVTLAAQRPFRHVVLAVVDRAFDPYGLYAADWDLLTRVPGLARLDIVVTDATLAGPLHERFHDLLPGSDEVRFEPRESVPPPTLVVPSGGALVHSARDREEEVADFARRVRGAARRGELPALDRCALVVRQPLPYVYVAREVLRSARVPCQMFDALPLAAEPFSAAVDLVFSFVSANFARAAAIALLRSPHFEFRSSPSTAGRPGERLAARDVAALDRALSESGYLGDLEALERLVQSWRRDDPDRGRMMHALLAGEVVLALARELATLRAPAPVASHLLSLRTFLTRYEQLPAADDRLRERHLRARGAILGSIDSLRDAYDRFDSAPTEFDDVAALVRRWIEGQTFAPRDGEAGVHIVDADSARFGNFDLVQLAGVIEGEWPDRPRRNIFYSPALLRELGWPAESDRLAAARASFADLIRLPASRLAVSVFTLEADALVNRSPLADELEHAALDSVEESPHRHHIFEYEALGFDPIDTQPLTVLAREWATRRRLRAPNRADAKFRGWTAPYAASAYSLSALERYQDCPFKYFAGDVLRLEEAPEDESSLSPRARGRFIHEVFQRFFECWDNRGHGEITPDRIDDARALFAEVADPLLQRLSEADAALERTRLFGSAISVGIVDVVLGLEASRPGDVRERWLEYRLEGDFTLGATDGRRVPLKGVADRIDLLSGNRLRVIDYKTGSAPNPRRALQVPIYALSAQERLAARDGASWTIDEASYIAFSGKRSFVPVVKSGTTEEAALTNARSRLFAVVEGIGRGEFPPRPHDLMICTYCAYSSVCRKDYVGDD